MKRLPVRALIGVAVLMSVPGCTGEQDRAVNVALSRYAKNDAKVLTYVPMVSKDCPLGGGCYTDVCVTLLLDADEITDRRVIFVGVSGMDDGPMEIRGEYPSLAKCQAKFNRG